MSKTWNKLAEHLRYLSEAKYRGKSDITLADLNKLFIGSEQKPGITGEPPDPKGGMVRCQYPFKPELWTGWQDQIGPALAIASTDTARTVQTGNAQGGTVHKTNWGGKVVNVSAPIRPHHNDRMGSTVDRYDVIMVGDIIDPRKGILTRIAWSPAIGSSEERAKRLQGLISGGQVSPLQRRPQGQTPNPPTPSPVPEPVHVPRIGQNVRPSADDDGVKVPPQGGGKASSDFKRRLAAISRSHFPDRDDED